MDREVRFGQVDAKQRRRRPARRARSATQRGRRAGGQRRGIIPDQTGQATQLALWTTTDGTPRHQDARHDPVSAAPDYPLTPLVGPWERGLLERLARGEERLLPPA